MEGIELDTIDPPLTEAERNMTWDDVNFDRVLQKILTGTLGKELKDKLNEWVRAVLENPIGS